MSHSCTATQTVFQFDCRVCDCFYDAINAMRTHLGWGMVDWAMELTGAELEFEFERLMVRSDPEHAPTLLIIPTEPYDELFDSLLEPEAMDAQPTMGGVLAPHSDVVEAQLYGSHVTKTRPTLRVLLPSGEMCSVRDIPAITGYGSPDQFAQEGSRSDDLEGNEVTSEGPQDDLRTLDDSVPEPQQKSGEEDDKVAVASSGLGSSTQANNTIVTSTPPQDDSEADTPSASTSASSAVDSAAATSSTAQQLAVEPEFGTKADQQVGQTRHSGADGRNHINPFRCMFCGCPSPPDMVPRADYPQMHRAGQIRRTRCPVYARLLKAGGEAFASFLLARWPQLLDAGFTDDQLPTGSTIRRMCREFARAVAGGTAQYTTKAQMALDAFQDSGTVPPVGGDFWDAELLTLMA